MKDPNTGRHLRLNKRQKDAKEHIRWLLDDGELKDTPHGALVGKNRQSGRSTLLAIVFIEMAMASPGREFFFFDHLGANPVSVKLMYDRLEALLRSNPKMGEFRLRSNSLTFVRG